MEKFSCLISCYRKDDPEGLKKALNSLACQTVKASEVLLVEDGPLTEELYQVIGSFESRLPLNKLQFKENKGLGYALKRGVKACCFPIIARMDADDICRMDRFEKQLTFLEQDPKLSVIGSWVSEFDKEEQNTYAIRKVPLTHLAIFKRAKYRSPMNHVSVMYRKAAVLDAGNYNPDFRFAQDYVLWIRMLSRGYKFANIPECLVNVKAGRGMINRRGGFKYIRYESALQREFLRQGFINGFQYCFNIAVRSTVRLIPGHWREVVYQKFLRK